MLDLGFVRNNLELVEEKLAQRNASAKLGPFREVDQKRRALLTEVETLKARRNKTNEQVPQMKREGKDTAALFQEMKALSDQIKELDEGVKAIDTEMTDLLLGIPNIPHSSVPVGSSAEQNQEVRKWGMPREFSFTPKPHWELGEALNILDQARAAKLTGARFAVYWDLGARLERAIANLMLDVHTSENGYREVLPPAIVNSASMLGTGQLPKFAEDLFKLENTDFWLIPTAEVPVTNLYRDEVLEEDQLPLSFAAYTPCFRSEAGSYGKDTRGIIRQHQFQKVELVKFSHPSASYDQLEKLTRDAETILQKLNLPYRTMALCTGDMGFGSAKTYDIEVWLPGQGGYREISSCSNYEAFQARRANIRFRSGKGKSELVHTLNGSGLAVGRTWIAIVENYQQEDGSILIPDALKPYMGGAERITANAALSKK